MQRNRFTRIIYFDFILLFYAINPNKLTDPEEVNDFSNDRHPVLKIVLTTNKQELLPGEHVQPVPNVHLVQRYSQRAHRDRVRFLHRYKIKLLLVCLKIGG